jgi:hypothetical protein
VEGATAAAAQTGTATVRLEVDHTYILKCQKMMSINCLFYCSPRPYCVPIDEQHWTKPQRQPDCWDRIKPGLFRGSQQAY